MPDADRTDYSNELRETAVRMVAAGGPDSEITTVAKKLGIYTSTNIYDWLRQAGLSPPYGPGNPKSLPAQPVFEDDLSPRRPTPAKTRRFHSPEFKDKAVRALAMAVQEDQFAPVREVSKAVGINEGRMRAWTYAAGFGSEGEGMDYPALKAWGGKGPYPKHRAPSVPAVHAAPEPHSTPLHEEARDNGHVLTPQLQWALAEIKRLEEQVQSMKREREVFISASTILGRERQG